VFDAISWIVDFLSGSSGYITDLLEKWTAHLIEAAVVAKIKIEIWAVKFSWGVAADILKDIGAADAINAGLDALPSEIHEMLNYFGFPAAINTILNAAVTKFVLRFLGL